MSNNTRQSKVLLVDDHPDVLKTLRILFCDEYEVQTAASGPEAIKLVEQHDDITVVVLDIKMANMDGITTGRKIRELRSEIPIIFHTAYPGEYSEDQISDTEQPFDYVTKGDPSVQLIDSVHRAVIFRKMQQTCTEMLSDSEWGHSLLGRSHAIRDVLMTVYRVAMSKSKVLIAGEAGTGRENAARFIHSCGSRNKERFVVFRCSERTPIMIESVLFGHKAGAFPGATSDSPGMFEYADGGTIFFDKIEELDISSQTTLLGVLETGQYQPVGSPSPKAADVRVICSTQRNLPTLIKEKRFREDLLLLIKGVTIKLPPLRDRTEDIPILANSISRRLTAHQDLSPRVLDRSAMSVLLEYPWPGNVKQLSDTIEAAISLSDSELIIDKDVREILGTNDDYFTKDHKRLSSNLAKVERRLIVMALHESDYNISNAAAAMDIDRSVLSRKIKKYSIDTRTLKETLDDDK